MSARVLMIQGTGSDVGKSVVVAGLCRLARQRGWRVAPFKPQNMSNNAAACAAGGEIGRAQALQARAAGLEPHPDFNPVLLKPQTDRGAQIVVHGKPVGLLDAADYTTGRAPLMTAVMQSFQRLVAAHDLVLVEGAGSPAEVNLRTGDIANMGFALAAGVPVCLVGDIDRGGVIAALVGTQSVLAPEDSALIVGFLVNKFRGDPALFTQGVAEIERRTGWPCFGVVPWMPAATRLPAEDAVSLSLGQSARTDCIRIAAPLLSRLANFDDADPLRFEPDVDFTFVPPGRPIPRDVDIVILFGTKSTNGDLDFLRAQGWDHDVIAHARAGGRVLGVCGGFQMLGRHIHDPAGADGPVGSRPGLGLLELETTMAGEKTVRPARGHCTLSGASVAGYEIHTGQSDGRALTRPMFQLEAGPDGARSQDGLIEGTYLHGLFGNDTYRRAWLGRIRNTAAATLQYEVSVEAALDDVAATLADSVDTDALFSTARRPGLAKPAAQMP